MENKGQVHNISDSINQKPNISFINTLMLRQIGPARTNKNEKVPHGLLKLS